MKEYVLGFMFSLDRQLVALIIKAKPEWQAGKMNGVGGKIEPGEFPLEAMRREFLEETGVDHAEWEHRLTMFGNNTSPRPEPFRCLVFRCFSDKINSIRTTTNEQILTLPVAGIPHVATIENLKWIIPYLLDGNPKLANVEY